MGNKTNPTYGKDFKVLDLEALEKKYKLKKITWHNDILYITSQQDEWYIICNPDNLALSLYHKNKGNNKRNYHKENMTFNTVFQILGYINHHDQKIFGLGHSGKYRKSRMEILFEQISANKSTKTVFS